MADKIKKFFQKKKSDAKFKLAGPGHKLSDATISSRSSTQSERQAAPSVERSGLSEESKVAADAALSRLQSKRDNPFFNTSVAAIQAQVKKELEMEKANSVHEVERQSHESVAEKEQEKPDSFAAAGVFFRCPMIGPEILPREQWKENIKAFLYEQLEFERGLTACLIIQSCNKNKEKIDLCTETLCKYLENIVTNPEEEKYKKIRMCNRVFSERVRPIEGAMELLSAAGFTEETLTTPDGTEETYLVFKKENVDSVESLVTLIDALRTAEPIQVELDRNLQVLLPSQAAMKFNLPSSFYNITPEELKREQRLRAEAMEKSQMLRTKAMREKDELREMRKYKFAIIRIRFPDGILIQGTFSVYEKYEDIHSFVRENLENDLPFVLNTPTGHKLILDEDSTKTLIDLKLVPATILTFAWHPSAADASKDVYLKPEVMLLVQEI